MKGDAVIAQGIARTLAPPVLLLWRACERFSGYATPEG